MESNPAIMAAKALAGAMSAAQMAADAVAMAMSEAMPLTPAFRQSWARRAWGPSPWECPLS